ncbi:hypothetical protein GDO78_009422 [Eleutherodactylus coqui]|uniref:non-specific serine/threonine protein kinase n=2 Tax=Eleutherodactylus coqui TaxID=57060 RepID=A0A8J6FB11_ELECQ|nr:hypothetical protein GDO78_009422 [Eleutherodactylus coqui]
MIYGSMPFDNSNYKTLAEQIGSGLYRQPPHLSGACGLIDWMLTVNPSRRATIEDIANHWWVNWGYDTMVCDCDLVPECQSPLLARYIECQNTQCFKKAQKEHCNSQQKEEDEYEGCLRKSKKENDINQSQQEPELIVHRQKPKGILKKRSSFDSSFPNSNFSENLSENCLELDREAQTTSAYEPHRSINIECTFNVPKKGILKKTSEMESGYSSSPERMATSEIQKTYLTVPQEKVKSDKHSKTKKGILKKNGRFSASLDLPGDCSTLKLSESTEDLLMPNVDPPKSPSRPSSVISDDSFLSSDSFDQLDMTCDTKSQLYSYISRNHFYSSEEEDVLNNKLIETVCSRDHKL